MVRLEVTIRALVSLVISCVLLAASTQGRYHRRIHKRHNEEAKNFGVIETAEERERNLPFRRTRVKHHSRGRMFPDETTTASDYEDDGGSAVLADFRDWYPSVLSGSSGSSEKFDAIRKRRNGVVDETETMSNDEEMDYRKSRASGIDNVDNNDNVDNRDATTAGKKRYEVEVREAQNSSLCNYTVIDVPDPSLDNSRVPKNLVNVMCNHAGSRCRRTGTYCCVQTYRKIRVSYSDDTTETIKIYTGCVCSLRFYARLKQYQPRVPIYH